MKIVQEEVLKSCGAFAVSAEWKEARKRLLDAIRAVAWPPRGKLFTIYPEAGRKRDEGNGVKPIKDGLMSQLHLAGWAIEGQASNARGEKLGKFDAVYQFSRGACVLEWETGNVSSSHRSMNKMSMLLSKGIIAAGILVVPSRAMYRFLTDRVGNFEELQPYFDLWRSVPCEIGNSRDRSD